jgi:tRNA(Ile)-lysidine synthase
MAAGCPAGALTAAHVARVEELVTGWHGQRGVDLPGGVRAARRSGEVLFERALAVNGAANGLCAHVVERGLADGRR